MLSKQKTAYEMQSGDWSSDVCSSDLRLRFRVRVGAKSRASVSVRLGVGLGLKLGLGFGLGLCSLSGSSVHVDSPGKNTGMGCHALLQGIFLTQGLNRGLLHCRRILYHLSHQGSPRPSGTRLIRTAVTWLIWAVSELEDALQGQSLGGGGVCWSVRLSGGWVKLHGCLRSDLSSPPRLPL